MTALAATFVVPVVGNWNGAPLGAGVPVAALCPPKEKVCVCGAEAEASAAAGGGAEAKPPSKSPVDVLGPDNGPGGAVGAAVLNETPPAGALVAATAAGAASP